MSARRAAAGGALYGAVYTAALYRLSGSGILPAEEALTLAAVLGVAFPALALLLLRGSPPPSSAPETTARGEAAIAIALLVLVSAYLAAGAGLIDQLLPSAWVDSPRIHGLVVLAKKLVVFVVLPYAAMRALYGRRAAGYGLSPAALRTLAGRPGVSAVTLGILLCTFQWFAGRGATPIRTGALSGAALAAALVATFVWNLLEVGLVEEFFFRGFLQARLAALLRSPGAAVFVAALLFGLAHAPGYMWRGAGVADGLGTHPAALDALAYTVAVPGVASFLFAVLWLRTRNLYVGIVVHAAIDLLPQAAEGARAWGLA
jgi:membrane protease YdiL (CAAX protease family)